jgi:aryl-alcohol dehydrogenase-like predicted oxidoreductase
MARVSLPVRALGRSGLEITPVGLGAWAMGGGGWVLGWSGQDDADSIATILRAVGLGVNWIDTAAVYGLGHSEEIVGTALRRIPAAERPYVFTKCGLMWDENDRMSPPRRIGDPAQIRRECDASLSRLGVERIDLYQLHFPPEDGTPLEEAWGAMLELVQAGKVAAVGASNFDVESLERCRRLGGIDSLQPAFSLMKRSAAADVIPWCAAHATGVIVYSPMYSGLLSGRFTLERARALPADDWRSGWQEFQMPRLERNLELAAALAPVAERHGVSPAAGAVAWTTSWPGVTAAIVGARAPAQVDDWIAAAGLRLSDRDMAELAGALRRTGAGSGPIDPP